MTMEDLKNAFFKNSRENDFTCTHCGKLLSIPPIYFSSTMKGNICGRCVTREQECGGDLLRQSLFESVARFLIFPCSYKLLGCKVELKWDEVDKHEKSCIFKNTICPLSNKKLLHLDEACPWRGNNTQLASHLELAHKEYYLNPPQVTLDEKRQCKILFTQTAGQTMTIVIKYDESFNKYYFHILANLSDIECNFFRYQLEMHDGSKEHSMVLRKNKLEPLSEFIFNDKLPENSLELDLYSVKQILKKPAKISVKFGIVKKSKKELQVLKESLPEYSILNTPSQEKALLIDEEMLQELECPVCNDYMIPPIFICSTGHSVCSTCNRKVSTCPTCRSNMQGSRNFTLEKLTSLVNYPCRNRITGCFFVSSADKIRSHEKTCRLTGKQCILKCQEWKGTTMDMILHLNEKHSGALLKTDTVLLQVQSTKKTTTQYALCYDNHVFLYTLTAGVNLPIRINLECLAMEKPIYAYEFHLIHATDAAVKMSVSLICQNIGSGAKGTLITSDIMQSFVCENKFYYKIVVLKRNTQH